MSMIRTMIVDDEELARERLRGLLRAHPDVEIIGEADNGPAAVERIEEAQPDLVFLDIEMPGCNGLEVVRSLTARPLPRVIFCTAYDQYAIQAFELNAVDYLLKPVTRARLAESVQRVARPAAPADDLQKRLESIVASLREAGGGRFMRRFLGRRAKRIHVIQEAEVIYFKVDRNLLFAVTGDGEYWTNYTISQVEEAADPEVFLRTHRQYMVNLNKVREVAPLAGGSYQLTMSNGHAVEVSRRLAKRLLEALK